MKNNVELNTLCLELLKKWCDSLIQMQIITRRASGVYGGILCDECGRIHRRSGEVVFPLVALYAKTGDEKYLMCADRALDWAENNITPRNDFCLENIKPTLYFAINLGETLINFKNSIPKNIYNKWYAYFEKTVQGIKLIFADTVDAKDLYVSSALICVFSFAATLTKASEYLTLTIPIRNDILNYLQNDTFLTTDDINDYSSVSLYENDFEQIISNLSVYANNAEDKEIFALCGDMLSRAALLMLPNGAYSYFSGTNLKNTALFGVKNTCGIQTACSIHADESNIAYEMAFRNTQLLYNMSSSALLSCNADNKHPCILPTILHASGVAHIVNNPFKSAKSALLPQDSEQSILNLKKLGTTLIVNGDWHISMHGSSPALIYNKKAGALFCSNGGMSIQNSAVKLRDLLETACQTLRIVMDDKTSLLCKDSEVYTKSNADSACYSVRGQLSDSDGNKGNVYRIFYTFSKNTMRLSSICEADSKLFLPLICGVDTPVNINGNVCSFTLGKVKITLTANVDLLLLSNNLTINKTSGFCTLPLFIKLPENETVNITVCVD